MQTLITHGAAALVGAALSLGVAGAAAQEFPSEEVTIVVPFNAGGGTDTLARIIQPALEDVWGQTVVIENQPGASGLVGTLAFLRDSSEGHRLLMASTGAILSLAREGRGIVDGEFRIEEVLQPISQVSQPPYIATVNPENLDVASIQELIDYAKENPGEVTFGSSGVGAASHLTGVLFQQMADVELSHVPYTGMGEAGPALLAGEIDLLFAPAPVVQSYFEDGSLQPLALTTAGPSRLFPDLPSIAETLEGFSIAGWFGLFGHPDTPEERIQSLSEDVQSVLQREAIAEQMAEQGGAPAPMSPEEYTEFLNDDIATWRELQATVDTDG